MRGSAPVTFDSGGSVTALPLIRSSVWFGLLHSAVSAECIRPFQSEDRFLPCLQIAGFAVVPYDELAIAGGTSQNDPRILGAEDVKSMLELRTARTPRKDHRKKPQAPIKRINEQQEQAHYCDRPCKWATKGRQVRRQGVSKQHANRHACNHE